MWKRCRRRPEACVCGRASPRGLAPASVQPRETVSSVARPALGGPRGDALQLLQLLRLHPLQLPLQGMNHNIRVAILVEIGIGLHAGDAFCGAIGDAARLEFSVLGDTVNVAARLEQEAKAVGLRLVVSRNFLKAAGEMTESRDWQPLGSRSLRGRAQPVELLGAQPFQHSANDE